MLKTSKFFATVLLLASFVPMSGRQIHVSKQGTDSNAGTAAKPFYTISKAAYKAIAGDTVIVHAGTYREWVSPENGGKNNYERIVYMAAPGEKVCIKGSEELTGWVRTGNVWKAEMSNRLFAGYNPFAINYSGDWMTTKNPSYHLGAVYLNNKALKEKLTVVELASTPMTWFAEVGNEATVVYANFGDQDPNTNLVEVNARQACFMPKCNGVNYITVKGFDISQAAPQWAPPAAEQQGMVGPNWSKGWVIEDCIISNSRNVGISLGKHKTSGHNRWYTAEREGVSQYNMHGFNREIEVGITSREMGWCKEFVGSHLIQNNKIFDCVQAGIVGRQGCSFSIIRHNEIYDINVDYPEIGGGEVAGIKLHAPIDVVIEDNVISNCWRGIWMDWQAQGTIIRGNILFDNRTQDLFVEVSHGPTIVYENILLSECQASLSLMLDAQGVAVFNNLIQGAFQSRQSQIRYTPYHYPHSTAIKGLFNNTGGDCRFYNNIFLGNNVKKYQQPNFYGLSGYNEFPHYNDTLVNSRRMPVCLEFKLPVWMEGNVYFHLAKPSVKERNFVHDGSKQYTAKIEKRDGAYYLVTDLPNSVTSNPYTVPVNTVRMGCTTVSECPFENPDGSPFEMKEDYFGKEINQSKVNAGPFTKLPGNKPVWKW